MTDDQKLESLIEASDGHFVDDEFRISGKDLMNLLRAVHCAAPPPASTNRLTDEQIEALRIAADALIEKYAEPIREILRNAEQP